LQAVLLVVGAIASSVQVSQAWSSDVQAEPADDSMLQ
jgi:hypothetical protein